MSKYKLVLFLALSAVPLSTFVGARAQSSGMTNPTQLHDPTALKPPADASVALIEFADLECPDCARANPLLKEAAAKFGIPWVRHDFPLPSHTWSMNAAINARWFDTKSTRLGNEYRDAVFAQ
jgi:protein-disulfide isomerase